MSVGVKAGWVRYSRKDAMGKSLEHWLSMWKVGSSNSSQTNDIKLVLIKVSLPNLTLGINRIRQGLVSTVLR